VLRLKRHPHGQAGMVTAEAAVVLPVLLFVLAGAVAAVTVVGAQLRCVDAAREGARAAARGEVAVARSVAAQSAPSSAGIAISVVGEQVHVVVSARIAPLGPVPLHVTVSAEAVALVEPGVAG
jgi:Flp pilus assembly protein TadG